MIELRRVTAGDAADLFRWRNDPASRAASVNHNEVPWDSHVRWLESVINDPARFLYLATENDSDIDDSDIIGSSLAMCRFDVDATASNAEVSINLNPDARGRKLARPILATAINTFMGDVGKRIVLTAVIRSDNPASIRLFEGESFELTSSSEGLNHYSR